MNLKTFRFERVNSTNNTAFRIIKKTNLDYGMIISEMQSNGRGQYGKKWISLKGNIFLSFFYRLDEIKLPFNFLTRKNCYLVKNIILKYYKKKIIFKPPNDLIINRKKICGILQEKVKRLEKDYLIVGIGINLIKNPKISNYPTTNLFEVTNKKINKKKFEKELKISFEKFLSKYYK